MIAASAAISSSVIVVDDVLVVSLILVEMSVMGLLRTKIRVTRVRQMKRRPQKDWWPPDVQPSATMVSWPVWPSQIPVPVSSPSGSSSTLDRLIVICVRCGYCPLVSEWMCYPRVPGALRLCRSDQQPPRLTQSTAESPTYLYHSLCCGVFYPLSIYSYC